MRNDTMEMQTADPAVLHATAEVDKIISPILYVLGFPGNILSCVLWLRPRMRHSSGIYLAALGFVDLLFLVLHVLFELYKVWNIQMFDAPVVCELLPIVYMATQYLSPLLVMGFTVERFIGVWFPTKRKTFCTTTRAKIVSLGLAIFALTLGSMQGYFYQFNDKHQFCGLREEAMRGGHASLWSIWTWITEMMIFLCVPLLILTFNLLIIKQVKRLSEFETSCKERAVTTTFSLLLVSFYFILTTFPVSIVYAIRYCFFPVEEEALTTDMSDRTNYMLAKTIVEEIGMTHHALKFYIFLAAERAFRDELVHVAARLLTGPCRRQLGYEHQPAETTVQTDWMEIPNGDGQKPPEETNM
ncbi:uncharacterized protein LOC128228897 isoform X3 [Mya arenaria]|nr:uncharacterized protein LOC128228897 isoform X3 [Mya arenaria]